MKQSEFINESVLEFIYLHISTLSLYLPPYKSAIASGLSSTRKVRPVGWTPSRICLRSEPRIVTRTRRQARVVSFLTRGGFSFYVMQKIFLSSSFGQPYEVWITFSDSRLWLLHYDVFVIHQSPQTAHLRNRRKFQAFLGASVRWELPSPHGNLRNRRQDPRGILSSFAPITLFFQRGCLRHDLVFVFFYFVSPSLLFKVVWIHAILRQAVYLWDVRKSCCIDAWKTAHEPDSMCKSGDLSGLRYGSVVMRERVGAIEANIQLGHSTDENFVFLRKK